jgi:ribonuclease G
VIVRTAAEGVDSAILEKELTYLYEMWEDLKRKADKAPAPALIHREFGLLERVIRDSLWSDVTAVHIDSERAYEQCMAIVTRMDTSMAPKIKLYGEEYPIFERFGVQRELAKALRIRSGLKSAGVDQSHPSSSPLMNTESLFESGAWRTQSPVLTRIRQRNRPLIRLRDQGIIVIDLADMEN